MLLSEKSIKKILFQLHHLSTAVNLHSAFKGEIVFHLSFLEARAWFALQDFTSVTILDRAILTITTTVLKILVW